MSDPIDRRTFTTVSAGFVLGATSDLSAAQPAGPVEAPFTRDYEPPKFQPGWKKPQVNRQLVQDFVIFAHMDFGMVKTLLAREPALLHGHMDWGGGDFESALGAASHMGNREIAGFLLEQGARLDLFCAAMLGLTDVVKGILAAQPKLIDAKGPHGIGLHTHARMGGKDAAATLDYLQSVKKVEFPKK